MLLIGIFLCMMTHYDFISMRNVQVSLEGSDIGIVYRNSHYFQGISGFVDEVLPTSFIPDTCIYLFYFFLAEELGHLLMAESV